MLATQIEVSDGTLNIINVGIEFFEQDDMTVSLDQADPLVLGVDYVWSAATTIQFLPTVGVPGGLVPLGVEVVVRRHTKNDEMYNVYDGGSPFNRISLDENFEQLLRLSQEFAEGLGLDGLQNNLDMNGYRIVNLGDAIDPTDAANLGQVRAGDAAVTEGYQAADANLQAQLTGNVPLEASAFSVISWHDQSVDNSVVIPDGVNAWSFGPQLEISVGQSVTIGAGSYWTIANGATTGDGPLTAEIPSPLDMGELP